MAENVSQEEQEAVTHGGAGRYVVVWIALVAFTVATYLLSRVELGTPWHLVVALAIAFAKGTLVALFFMHLWEQRGANRLVLVTSLVFVALLIGLVVADNATRFPLANPPNERNMGWMPPSTEYPRPEPKPSKPQQ